MLHKNSLVGDQHYVHNWEVADEAARLALVLTSGDIGKICRQLDTGAFFLLVDDSPLLWEALGTTGEIQTVVLPVKNNTGVSIPAGSPVYVSGASGAVAQITLADADAEATSSKTIGLTKTVIANGATGYVVIEGRLNNVNTSAFVAGDALYLSAGTPGTMTTTRPRAPNHGVFLGYVIKVDASTGIISVHAQNGYELQELHNVDSTLLADNDVLVWDTATNLWLPFGIGNFQPYDAQLVDLAAISYTGNANKFLAVNPTATGWQLVTVASGGLTYITETLSTAGIHATNNQLTLAVTGGSTRVDLAIVPKNEGSLSADFPDGGTTGGNKRGDGSVDWQTNRNNANMVASGSRSVISGGQYNRADGPDCVVGGGSFNRAGVNTAGVFSGNGNTATGYCSVIAGGATITVAGEYAFVGAGNSNLAAGARAAVVGGSSNSASFPHCFVGGGTTNTASADEAVVVGGNNNQASGARSNVAGGTANQASAALATVGGGRNNLATGINSFIPGGSYAHTRGRQGSMAIGGGPFPGSTVSGLAQRAAFVHRRITTDATPALMSADGGTTVTGLFLIGLADSSINHFKGTITARQHTTGDAKVWEVEGVIKRGVGVGTVAFVGTPTITVIAQDTGAAAWAFTVLANTTEGALTQQVTGEAAKTIRWNSVLDFNELVEG